LLRKCIVQIAEAIEESYEHVIKSARSEAANKMTELEQQIEKIEAKLQRSRRLKLLPNANELYKITRYEVHLERSFYKVISELERIQAARMAKPIEIPVIDVNRQIEEGII
jgi:ribosome-binding protein aMBF1 (putative translation factor)